MKDNIEKYFESFQDNFLKLENQAKAVTLATTEIVKSFKFNKKLIFCRNGGSTSDTKNLVTELVGIYKKYR